MTAPRPNPRSPWRTDFSQVPAAQRRAARYALNILATFPALHERLEDVDMIGALWTLTRPLFVPTTLEQLEAQWSQPDPATEEDDEDELPRHLSSSRRARRHGLLQGVPGARMRAYLIRRFKTFPKTMLDRLNKADGRVPTHPSIGVLAQCAELDAVECDLVDFVEKKDSVKGFRDFLRETGFESFRDHYGCLSAALGVSVKDLQHRLHRRGALSRLQLVKKGSRRCDLEDFLSAEDLLDDLLALEPSTPDELLTAITEPCPSADWTLGDFPHLERDSRRMTTVLGNAARNHAVGVNALLYGPPGTGKTQFAYAIAGTAGLTPYQVKTADDDGDGLSRSGRLGAYQLTQRLLRGRTDCVIVFDEVEDVFATSENALLALFGGAPRAGNEKGWMNRTLEDNAVPAIWITNDADSMDRAFLRRFLLPVAFTNPPRRVRRQMVERHLGDGLVPENVLDELAADNLLVPAQFGAARRLLELQPDMPPEVVARESVSASRRLMTGSGSPHHRNSATAFDAAFLNVAGGIAPVRLADALARRGRGTLCFFGPPGTGKTEFAHVLADALDRELVVRASSDLVSPYVGQTEQNIARLFAEIDAERTVLLLDEVDSLLRDRRQAKHGWEATQVNELLLRMEQFHGIFIAATNLLEQIDTAALRRFDFKLQFKPLTLGQRVALFAREALGDVDCAQALAPALLRKLESLEGLTPGDFANVVKQRELLGEAMTEEEFLRRLILECRYKAGLQAAA
ncbi:ATP-binding protein [Azoarcus sp. KH32C]|uniref:AAA family ATPase n=1 Tax=Azoarcus sp. KH32C TaxID=748247 RepID=UPI0002385EA7|nr:AAA family ATPase [Azoarcus sp. KH32C]BAL23466.1 ATPase, AAA family protein [Azoarcus sp. KH32C]